MIIADTSVWIDFLKKSDPDLVDILKKYLKKGEVFGVSAIFGELLQGVKNKRERDIIYLIWDSLPKIEEKALFLKAGELSNQYKLYAKGVGLIDCLLMAAAIEHDFVLWTLDKKLQAAIDIVSKDQ